MKAYTDIEQSKKLAEILPIESADMNYWCGTQIRIGGYRTMDKDLDIPCWSLSALLNVLPNEISTREEWENKYQIHIRKYNGGGDTTFYQIAYGNNRGASGSWHDMINTSEKGNLIDACVEMIMKLNELNLL